jgi:hypothetical protein
MKENSMKKSSSFDKVKDLLPETEIKTSGGIKDKKKQKRIEETQTTFKERLLLLLEIVTMLEIYHHDFFISLYKRMISISIQDNLVMKR